VLESALIERYGQFGWRCITVQGGTRILKLEQAQYDMFRHRPVHRWFDGPLLF
jgi:hypothetical protein